MATGAAESGKREASGVLSKQLWLTPNMLIAAVPVLGSVFAYIFEAGYLAYFDVPLEYIEVGLNRILVGTFALISIGGLIYIASTFIFALAKSEGPIRRRISMGLLLSLFFLVFVFLLEKSPWLYLVPLAFFLLYTGLHLLAPLFRRNKSVTYTAQVAADLKSDHSDKNGSAAGGVLGVAVIGAMFVFLLGHWWATQDTSRWVLEDARDTIVVRKYGNLFILKKFDPKTSTLTSTVTIKTLASGESLRMRRMAIPQLSHGE